MSSLFLIDDVSEHVPDLMPEHSVDAHVRQRLDSLSIQVPCLLPVRLSGWGSLEVLAATAVQMPNTVVFLLV